MKREFIDFVKEHWGVFLEYGVKTPVHEYEIVIDVRYHQPIAIKSSLRITRVFNNEKINWIL